MAGHTPGPWEITENLGRDEAWCDWHQVGPIHLMGGKANANSRLIAAAPDMLEALRYVETRCVSEAAYPHASLEDRKMRDLVVAAIAKAEGRP